MSGVQIPYSALYIFVYKYKIMKDKKIRKLIQKPLRFHHQDIHEELEEIKELLKNVISQMQNMQCRIDQYEQNSMLRMSESNDSERK